MRVRGILGIAPALALLAACSSGGGGAGPSGLDAPAPGHVFGNWIVDGASIDVIADSGEPHPVRGGNALRIDPAGVDVLLDASVREGSVFHRQSQAPSYQLISSAVGARFELSLTLDFSIPGKQLAFTDYRVVTCDGEVRNDVLHVRYLAQQFFDRVETDRDEVQFRCRPGVAVQPEMTGAWEVTAFEVIADTGEPHQLKTGDLLVVEGAAVVQLFADAWVPRQFRTVAAVRPPSFPVPRFADALRVGTAAYGGRVEGEIAVVGGGPGMTFPGGVPARLRVWFEFVRAGDVLSGRIYLQQWRGGFINFEVDVLAVTMRLRT